MTLLGKRSDALKRLGANARDAHGIAFCRHRTPNLHLVAPTPPKFPAVNSSITQSLRGVRCKGAATAHTRTLCMPEPARRETIRLRWKGGGAHLFDAAAIVPAREPHPVSRELILVAAEP